MFDWTHLGADIDGFRVVFLCHSTEVARLMRRVDTGVWFAVLDQHRPYD